MFKFFQVLFLFEIKKKDEKKEEFSVKNFYQNCVNYLKLNLLKIVNYRNLIMLIENIHLLSN